MTLYFDASFWRFILTLYFDALFWRFILTLYFDALFDSWWTSVTNKRTDGRTDNANPRVASRLKNTLKNDILIPKLQQVGYLGHWHWLETRERLGSPHPAATTESNQNCSPSKYLFTPTVLFTPIMINKLSRTISNLIHQFNGVRKNIRRCSVKNGRNICFHEKLRHVCLCCISHS